MKLTIPGRLPGLNEYINVCRANKQAGAEMKRIIETKISWYICQQLRGLKLGPVSLKFGWYEANKKRDKDNIAFAKKFVLDALQETGIISGDGWSHIIGFSDDFYIDRANPRVEIDLLEG